MESKTAHFSLRARITVLGRTAWICLQQVKLCLPAVSWQDPDVRAVGKSRKEGVGKWGACSHFVISLSVYSSLCTAGKNEDNYIYLNPQVIKALN